MSDCECNPFLASDLMEKYLDTEDAFSHLAPIPCTPKPKKRKRSGKFGNALATYKQMYWWSPTPEDINRELLLRKLSPLNDDAIAVVFSFTDFWTLAAVASFDADDLGVLVKLANKELKNRLKF